MKQPTSERRKNIFRLLLFSILWLPFLGLSYLVLVKLYSPPEQEAVLANLDRLSEEEREEFYNFMARQIGTPGIFDIKGEPYMGRILQASRSDMETNGAPLQANRAGMRSRREYETKKPGTYRIVCLGDSFAFGNAGLEEDRYADQMEQILRDLGVTAQGASIEVLAVGISSWNAVNETTYMISRLSAYAPDLILPLFVSNDLEDTIGITGFGAATRSFSPERQFGYSTFSVRSAYGTRNLLSSDMGTLAKTRWASAFRLWKRLETLQSERGGRMLFAVLDERHTRERPNAPALWNFVELTKLYHQHFMMRSPMILANYFFDHTRETALPHDAHPNRRGHRIIALHYLHVLAKLGWLDIDRNLLPPLDPRLSLETRHSPDLAKIATANKEMAERLLLTDLVFADLKGEDAAGILGGILLIKKTKNSPNPIAYGTQKTAFLIKRAPESRQVAINIEVEPLPELFPFKLEMYLDGRPAAVLELASKEAAGVHVLRGPIDDHAEAPEPAIEVILRTDSYICGIVDHRTLSYRLLSARQQ